MTLNYIWRSFSLGCYFHVHFSYPWHAFLSHGLPAIAELLVTLHYVTMQNFSVLRRCIQNVGAKAPATLRNPPSEPVQLGYAVPAGIAWDAEVGVVARCLELLVARRRSWLSSAAVKINRPMDPTQGVFSPDFSHDLVTVLLHSWSLSIAQIPLSLPSLDYLCGCFTIIVYDYYHHY